MCKKWSERGRKCVWETEREREKATEKLEQKHLVRYEIINEEFTVIGWIE